MKIYKVHYRSEQYSSEGFYFTDSKPEADKSVAKYNEQHQEDEPYAYIEIIRVRLTSKGILDALNTHAGHPDNG